MSNPIGEFIRKSRKKAGLTQEEFAMRSGLGIRFVHELEAGKPTVRLKSPNRGRKQELGFLGRKAKQKSRERARTENPRSC